MAEKKRWMAMYTKHIKQKRKVYHDGFLDLQVTRKKVMLYDEADNLLETRMLKADEVVSSGETLTFQAYLVDICDPEGSKVLSDPKLQPSDQGCPRKPFAVLRPNFKKSSLHCEERKPNLVDKVPSKNLSPSQKMIRVFKKRQLHNYGALSPDMVKPTTKGTLPLGSANKEGNNQPLINLCDDSGLENNNKFSKDIPLQKPFRDVNQILSILQKPITPGNVIEPCSDITETCFDDAPQKSVSSAKERTESDGRKRHKMEPVSARASRDENISHEKDLQDSCQLHNTVSEAGETGSSITFLNDLPSFDLGI